MKPARLGVLDRQVISGDAVPLEVKRVVQRAIDEMYFTAWIAAGDGVAEGIVTTPKNGDEVVMRFPVAVFGTDAFVQRSVPARPLWVRTRPRLRIWYTSPVGSTNLFTIRFVLRVFGAGSSTTSTVFSVDVAAPGPTVANTVQVATVVGSALFPTSPLGVAQIRIGRIGGDGNGNDLHVLLATVIFEEIA